MGDFLEGLGVIGSMVSRGTLLQLASSAAVKTWKGSVQ